MILFKREKGKTTKVKATEQDFKIKAKVGKKAKDKRTNRGDSIGLVYDKKGNKGYV